GFFAPPIFRPREVRRIPEAIERARSSYRPMLIFVHRDAEKIAHDERRREIPAEDDIIPIIPVRMTEAWLLIDEGALRTAAGNPNGSVPLDIPDIARLERLPDPKEKLRALLAEASGLHGRRRQRFDRAEAAARVAELIEDFSPLRRLPAFSAFWDDLVAALARFPES
ncbi:MAG TPA: DUF4276 family protein, partial [Candidatus Nanopelagicales bacterium]|nr:DUF4276 family protein [Candidatus Nanopelagicales bacterium]